LGTAIGHGFAQTRVGVDVAAADARRRNDLTDQLGEDSATRRVGLALRALDRCSLGMATHAP